VKFGDFEIVSRISRGGTAEVFRARMAGSERDLAVKIMLPSIANDQTYVDMFIDEAKVSSQLDHVNIARVINLGNVEGISICAGLEYAHNKCDKNGVPLNLVHRDVSPQNVMIGFDGIVKLIDFGIAKSDVGCQTKTRAGQVKGKLAYMSPEQLRNSTVDRRSDVFCAGILLWEMVTGRRLFFHVHEFQTVRNIREGIVPPPSQHNTQVSPDLEVIILKALANDADDRYQTADELWRALRTFAAGQHFDYGQSQMSEFMIAVCGRKTTKRFARGSSAAAALPLANGSSPGLPTVPELSSVKTLIRVRPPTYPIRPVHPEVESFVRAQKLCRPIDNVCGSSLSIGHLGTSGGEHRPSLPVLVAPTVVRSKRPLHISIRKLVTKPTSDATFFLTLAALGLFLFAVSAAVTFALQ